MLRVAIVAACVLLSGCTAALYGYERSGGGATAHATAGSVNASASGSNYAVRAGFGQPVPVTAPGGQIVVSSSGGAGAFLLGIAVIGVLDYFAGSAAAALRAPANRPIAHTCSCYGWRPDDERAAADESIK